MDAGYSVFVYTFKCISIHFNIFRGICFTTFIYQYFIGIKVQTYFRGGVSNILNDNIKMPKQSDFHFTLLKRTYYSELSNNI